MLARFRESDCGRRTKNAPTQKGRASCPARPSFVAASVRLLVCSPAVRLYLHLYVSTAFCRDYRVRAFPLLLELTCFAVITRRASFSKSRERTSRVRRDTAQPAFVELIIYDTDSCNTTVAHRRRRSSTRLLRHLFHPYFFFHEIGSSPPEQTHPGPTIRRASA